MKITLYIRSLPAMKKEESRELRTEKSFKVPIDLMWDVWTNPKHLANWWGPLGFTITTHEMDVSEGGEWRLTLHGPDGTNFPNRSVFKQIIPNQKIVFEHFNPHFLATIIFDSKNETTKVEWTLEFDTVEMREIIVSAHKADDGQRQNLEKLEKYLSTILMP